VVPDRRATATILPAASRDADRPGGDRAADAERAALLLAVLGRDWPAAEARAPLARREPRAFLDLCRECDVEPWIHAVCEEAGRQELLGPDCAAALAERRRKVRNDNMLLVGRAEQALDVLAAAGVVPVALKGLDLLHRAYDRLDLRTVDDVDLLVTRDALRDAVAALERAGWTTVPEPRRTHYLRSSHHLPMRSPGPVPVDFELHWNLVQEMRYRVDPRALVARAAPLDVGGRRILRLEDHDLVAHLLLHHFTHYFDRRLKWVIDMERIAARPGFDWEIVVDRVREWEATVACGASALHVAKVRPRVVPSFVLERLPVGAWRLAATAWLRTRHPLDLFRGTRRRGVQLYLAAVMLERPSLLPGWLVHRRSRDLRGSDNPLDDAGDGAGSSRT
jgi:hypothetical protein